MRCILIETKDKRKFFTHEKNIEQIKSFLQIFEADVKKVDIKKGKMLNLQELAVAICDPTVRKDDFAYETINEKIEVISPPINKPSATIRSFIYKKIIENKTVSIKELKEKFQNLNLCDATFYNHFKKVKDILEKQGIKLTKVSPGNFKKK